MKAGSGRPRPGAVLALGALLLAGLAPLAGSGGEPGRIGVAELSRELARGEPLVDAITVAEWIRDRRPVDLVDVRDSSAHIRFSIPTARRVRLAELGRLDTVDDRPVVLYDDGGGQAVRGWLLLRRLGHGDVRILHGGVVGWVDGVLNPVLPAGTPEERARYERVAGISRYFGGLPEIGRPTPAAERSADEAVRLLSRRGCY